MRKTERKKVLRSRRAAELLTFSTTREIKEGEKIKKKNRRTTVIFVISCCVTRYFRRQKILRELRETPEILHGTKHKMIFYMVVKFVLIRRFGKYDHERNHRSSGNFRSPASPRRLSCKIRRDKIVHFAGEYRALSPVIQPGFSAFVLPRLPFLPLSQFYRREK